MRAAPAISVLRPPVLRAGPSRRAGPNLCGLACAVLLPWAASAAAPVDTLPPAVAASSADKGGAVERRVSEDDKVRIEEVRVRGQVQRVTVHSKISGGDYEIIVGPGGRDPSQKRDAAGQRAWSLFNF